VIQWNIIAFIALVCSAMSGLSATMTLLASRRGGHLVWGILSLCVSVWCLGLFLVFSAATPDQALFWTLMLNCFAVFLPPLVWHFVSVFLGRSARDKIRLRIYYALAFAGLAALLLWPGEFVHSPERRMDMFWFPLAGPVFYVFSVYYTWVMGHAIVRLLRARPSQSRQKRLQAKYLLISVLGGSLAGGSTIPLEFGVDMLPLGILGVAIMNVLFTYAILRHNLLSIPETISLVLARLMAYLGVVSCSILMAVLLFSILDIPVSEVQLLVFGVLTIAGSELYFRLKESIQGFADRVLAQTARARSDAVKRFSRELDEVDSLEALEEQLHSLMEALDFVHFYAAYLEENLWRALVKDDEMPVVHASSSLRRVDRHVSPFGEVLPEKLVFSGDQDADSTATHQMTALMSGEQLDRVYDWVDTVPQRELLVLPLVFQQRVRGVLMLVVGEPDFRFPDQSLLASVAQSLGDVFARLCRQQQEKFAAQQQLRERLSSMRAMAGSIAHEMRSPLGQMDFFVTEMEQFFRQLECPQDDWVLDTELITMRKRLQLARTGIQRSLQIIDMTLDQVRSEQPETASFQFLSLVEVLDKALREYRFLPAERDCVVNAVDADFRFLGDETLFIYLIFNLLKNALCYTHYPDFQVEFRHHMEAGIHCLVIEDNGPGIEPESVPKLFDDFFTTQKVGGTGLGLAYCKRVMRAFGGDIRCESRLGHYTRFVLLFPHASL